MSDLATRYARAIAQLEDLGQDAATDLDFAVQRLRDLLPGFWWRGGTCALSSEAIIAPDHNCPTHGERLHREFPPSVGHWNAGVEVELRPGSDHNLSRALHAATLRAVLLAMGVDPAHQIKALKDGKP